MTHYDRLKQWRDGGDWEVKHCAVADVIALMAERDELLAILNKLRWKSIDRDNMEFECRVTCYEMDAIAKATGGTV